MAKAKAVAGGKPRYQQRGSKRKSWVEEDEEGKEHVQWSKSKKKRMRLLKSKGRHNNVNLDALEPKEDHTSHAQRKQESSNKKQEKKDLDPNSKQKPSNTKKEQDSIDDTSSKKVKQSKQKTTGSALQTKFQQRLSGSRFRSLNEELYTSTSSTAFARFQDNPVLFDEYHQGFRKQASQWPINPVSIIADKIMKQHKKHEKQKKKNRDAGLVVADFGCGDAALAEMLQTPSSSSSRIIVHSLDLVARGPRPELITPCDIAHTPLAKASVDVGVFCLALMGTNLADFIREAHRVLKDDAILHIVEVRSRFEETSGRKSVNGFLNVLEQLGFTCTSMDRSSSTMFVFLELRKNGNQPSRSLAFTAKPCVYKRR